MTNYKSPIMEDWIRAGKKTYELFHAAHLIEGRYLGPLECAPFESLNTGVQIRWALVAQTKVEKVQPPQGEAPLVEASDQGPSGYDALGTKDLGDYRGYRVGPIRLPDSFRKGPEVHRSPNVDEAPRPGAFEPKASSGKWGVRPTAC
jgi:hypothetical protein